MKIGNLKYVFLIFAIFFLTDLYAQDFFVKSISDTFIVKNEKQFRFNNVILFGSKVNIFVNNIPVKPQSFKINFKKAFLEITNSKIISTGDTLIANYLTLKYNSAIRFKPNLQEHLPDRSFVNTQHKITLKYIPCNFINS